MPTPNETAANSIGTGRANEDPSKAFQTGAYKDAVEGLSSDAKALKTPGVEQKKNFSLGG